MKLNASLSLDLDDKWTYLKTHGDDSWRSYPSYLGVAIPRILEFLAEKNLTISFFLVGRDASDPKHHDLLREIAAKGHEICNHTFNHDPWLHLYRDEEISDELARAEEYIERATGKLPKGFRGPGFSISQGVLRVLVKRNYAYDATAFPNVLNPLARYYFLAKSDLKGEERERRKALFGSSKDALRPVKPYHWIVAGRLLLELPVTTMPLFKVPIHFSYLLYLGGYSPMIARSYFRAAIALCRATGTEPSLLLHPLDFLGEDDDRDLSFFPGMDVPSEKKLALMSDLVEMVASRFNTLSIERHVAAIKRKAKLAQYEPRFGSRNGSTAPTLG